MKQIAKMLLMVVLAIDLFCFSTLSTSQLDKTDVPLTYPARVINTEQVCPPYEEQVNQQDQVQFRTSRTWYAQPLYPPCAECSRSSPALLPPAVYSPPAVPLVTTGSGAAMGLQCRSTVTWIECVAAVTPEDGHVLPTLT